MKRKHLMPYIQSTVLNCYRSRERICLNTQLQERLVYLSSRGYSKLSLFIAHFFKISNSNTPMCVMFYFIIYTSPSAIKYSKSPNKSIVYH